jgi:hypothetical protein
MEINFDVASAGQIVADLHERTTKIRSRFVIRKARMKHPDNSSVQCLELIAHKTLVLPDGLQQILRRQGFVVFPQNRHDAAAGAPQGIKIGR